MLDIPPPEVLRAGNVTVVAPGPAYEHIYENMLDSVEYLIEVAATAAPPCCWSIWDIPDMSGRRFWDF
jgi:hypothetical protein